MEIYLIRHGESITDVEDRYGGEYDDELSEAGKKQAEKLAKRLAGKGIEVVFHSPKLRALKTAQIIAGILGVGAEVAENLKERHNYGILTGMTKSEARKKFPEEVEKLGKHTYLYNVKGSEDYEKFKKRVLSAFGKIASGQDHKVVAVVTHGGPIRCVFREVLKLGELESLGDCAAILLEKTNGKFKLVSMDGAELEK